MSERRMSKEKLDYVNNYLMENFNQMTMVAMSKELNIPRTTLTSIADELGLKKGKVKDIDKFILDNYNNMTVTEMSKVLKVERNTINRHAKKLGLSKNKKFTQDKFEISFDLKGIVDGYCVTNHGRVYNKKTGYLVNSRLGGHDYYRVSLSVNGIKKDYLLHRLIGIGFSPNPQNNPVINHISGLKTDNRPFNLQWTTIAENNKHAHANGLIDYSKRKRATTIEK